MTKKENFAELRTIATAAGRTDLVEFIDHEVELITKKNSAPKKPTAKQIENEEIKDSIIEVLRDSNPVTVTELTALLDEYYPGISSQRVSSMITQLKEDNSVVRTVVKRKAYFSLAE